MMKKIITISMILISGQCFTQSDLDTFDKKDVIEKLDRSDLDMNPGEKVEMDNSILKFEIPKMELDVPVKQKTVVKKTTAAKPVKAPVKKAAVVATQKVEKKQETVKSVKNTPAKKDRVKVVFAKRPISISQMKKNDKVVITKGKTYVYRMLQTNIIQYKYLGKMPYASKGLRKNDENSYYVVDKKLLMSDANNAKNVKSTPKVVKQPVIKPIAKSVENKVVSDAIVEPVSGLQAKRKVIEGKYNKGKTIKKTIELKKLHRNDEVYIVGDIQFVIRSGSNTGKKKYWLVEKLDLNNKSVEKMGPNKYKIIRFYKVQ